MVAKKVESYTVKHRGKTFKISKEELKRKNLDWFSEYKIAAPERRARILSDYYDYNHSFLNYFPQFHGTYRDEIRNILVGMLPKAFKMFNPEKGIDPNSYISMFFKKSAVKEFLFLLPTVQYNRFDKDPRTKRVTVVKAHCVSLDHLNTGNATDGHHEDPDGSNPDYLADAVTDYHLRRNSSNMEETMEGMAEMHHHFTGIARDVVVDFESGLRWNEVREKHGLSTANFSTLMEAIRIRLQRIMKENGRDARFIERKDRRARRDRLKRRSTKRVLGPTGGAYLAGEGFGEDYIQDERDTPPTPSIAIDKLWYAGEEEEDG